MIINTQEEMQLQGAALAKILTGGDIIFISGELGAGKTTLVRGLLKEKGYTGIVRSPTYSLVESYEMTDFNIHHFDLYRLNNIYELEEMGFRDYLNSTDIVLIEWPEQADTALPLPNIKINISYHPNGRNIEINRLTN